MSRIIDLIIYKTYAELRAETARGYLGILWWVIEPVLYMATFYFIFTLVFDRGGEDFVVFLLSGLVIWKWFNSSVASSLSSIRANYALIQQVYLPKYIFPLVVVVTNFLKFSLILLLFIIFLLVTGHSPGITWLFLPVSIFLMLLLITGASALVASISPVFPDLRIIVENGLVLMMFMSGIFFDISQLDATSQYYFYFNPVAILIDSFRDILVYQQWPDTSALLYTLIFSLTLISISFFILIKLDRIYPKSGL